MMVVVDRAKEELWSPNASLFVFFAVDVINRGPSMMKRPNPGKNFRGETNPSFREISSVICATVNSDRKFKSIFGAGKRICARKTLQRAPPEWQQHTLMLHIFAPTNADTAARPWQRQSR